MFDIKQYRRVWREQHKKLGLCVDCNDKAEEGRIRCQKHLDRQAEYTANRRNSLLSTSSKCYALEIYAAKNKSKTF